MKLSVIILAAGKGLRMQSKLPKVLHKLAGQTLLARVANKAQQLNGDVYVVYGNGGEEVREAEASLSVTWVKQEQLLGTGHAVLQVLPHIPEDHQVLVLVGDSPLVKISTLERLLDLTKPDGVGLVTAEVQDPTGLGRILHDQTGKVLGIVEERDANIEQRKIKEINSGIIIVPAKYLKTWLPELKNDNAQGEYYLTDIIELAAKKDIPVRSLLADSPEEVLGINDRIQQAKLERIFQRLYAEELMLKGVTLLDPYRFDARGEVEAEQDVIIDANVILEGKVHLGENSSIGPNCYLKNVYLGKNVEIKANSFIEDVVIGDGCVIGPFARIRPDTVLGEDCRVGNFVEIKKSKIGSRSKINHLSYIGDSEIGKEVNIGAGTITCNYDGFNKHKTIIKDGAFIGSDSQLVAPVTIEEGAYIGSGSTISKTAPANKLTVSRARQVTIEGWQKPVKKAD
jgi:bifunctional UDP-N-acetylglucosamine pyrophosphorylase/glucosamine-1-phosphate N-acetyltransferase